MLKKIKKYFQKRKEEREKRKMVESTKKFFGSSTFKYICAGVGVLLIIIFAWVAISNNNKQGYTEISYSELQNKVANKENFVLFIGRNTCSACSMYKEILNSKFAKEHKDVTIYYIDMDKLADGESATFNSTYDYSVTPTTVVLTNGKVQSNLDKVTGSDCYDALIKLLIKKGFIKG